MVAKRDLVERLDLLVYRVHDCADIFVTCGTCQWQVARCAEDAGLAMMAVGDSESAEPGVHGLAGRPVVRLPAPVHYARTVACYRTL